MHSAVTKTRYSRQDVKLGAWTLVAGDFAGELYMRVRLHRGKARVEYSDGPPDFPTAQNRDAAPSGQV